MEYNSAALDASKATQGVADLTGTSSGDDFKLLLEEKTRSSARVKQAREAYDLHIKNHGCATTS
jgi:hypothetical protein